MSLLHVQMLEIIQLMCGIKLRPHQMCITKVFQSLTFGSLKKLIIAVFIVMYLLELVFLIALNLNKKIGYKPTFSPTT